MRNPVGWLVVLALAAGSGLEACKGMGVLPRANTRGGGGGAVMQPTKRVPTPKPTPTAKPTPAPTPKPSPTAPAATTPKK